MLERNRDSFGASRTIGGIFRRYLPDPMFRPCRCQQRIRARRASQQYRPYVRERARVLDTHLKNGIDLQRDMKGITTFPIAVRV